MSWVNMDMDLFMVLRWIDIGLCVIVFAGMFRRFQAWAAQPVYVRLYGLGLGGLVGAGALALLISGLRNAPASIGTLVITIPLVWLVVATCWPSGQSRHPRARARSLADAVVRRKWQSERAKRDRKF